MHDIQIAWAIWDAYWKAQGPMLNIHVVVCENEDFNHWWVIIIW
jgi:hypothetical protein